MKHLITLFLLGALAPLSALAQKTEVSINLNSGLYSYGGVATISVSAINGTVYTNNPYGTRGGLSYGLSFNAKRITRGNFVFGADLGYEMLRSKLKLDYMDVIGDIASNFEGRTYLNTSFINLFPYLGGRFWVSEQAFDLVGGADLGYILSAREKGDAKSVDNSSFHIETDRDRKNLKTDFRPRIQLSTRFDQVGAYVGYAQGVKDYKAGMVGGPTGAYSRMWRVGLSYYLK